MKAIHFEWDIRKNETNIRKHKISFEEAKTVFYDENALIIADPEHSQDEDSLLFLLVRQLKTNQNIMEINYEKRI